MKFSQWVNQKLPVVSALAAGECNGDYIDAAVIASALLSGIASDLWPGEDNRDRKRFIELWATYSGPEARRVSVPLLIEWLRTQNRSPEALAIETNYPADWFLPGSPKILLGEDVDLSESDLQSLLPNKLPVADLRRYTYPALFYKYVRSSAVHKYQIDTTSDPIPGKRSKASARSMAHSEKTVSYSNHLDALDSGRRLIYFAVPWLQSLVSSLAQHVDERPRPLPAGPPTWWIEGTPQGAP